MSLSAISPEFHGRTPLWTYILAEAWRTSWDNHPEIADRAHIPTQLGPVGGHIVAETLAAALLSDDDSYPHAPGGFEPDPLLLHHGRFGLAELINTAIHRPGV